MCAIAGWVDHGGLPDDAVAIAGQMNDAQFSRGPDGSGLWHSKKAILAHRRLAVIDIDAGTQPMILTAPTGRDRLVLSYNGELYNYRELRLELAVRGHHFRTHSDTEVVLNAWSEWGPRAVEHFNGIFAFAIWDNTDETLWLVRDHLGVKPLHYHREGDRLLFASEAKGILAHTEIPAAVNEDGLRQLVLPLLKFPGTSPYSGVQEVPPGQILTFSRAGLRRTKYWDLAEVISGSAPTPDLSTSVSKLRWLLEDTVERQTIADVPLCTLLSGGLDSSLITALANAQPGRHGVESFSVDFSDAAANTDSRSSLDRRFAREAADFIGSRHTNIVLDAAQLSDPSVRDSTVRARDLPNGFGDLEMSLLLLCAAIRKQATVALSGEAADEILGGYKWFHDQRAFWSDTFPWIADTPAHGHLHQRVLATLEPDLIERLRLREYLNDEYTSALSGLDIDQALAPEERRHREVLYLGLTYFLPMLLDRSDRLSMASGLEIRVPFCDHRIVEHLVTLPRSVHNAGGREKGVLRDAVTGLLPTEVLERQKSPYPTTPDPDYSTSIARQVAEVVTDPPDGLREIFAPSLLDPDAIANAARSHGLVSNFEGEVILNFASWFRQYHPKLVS